MPFPGLCYVTIVVVYFVVALISDAIFQAVELFDMDCIPQGIEIGAVRIEVSWIASSCPEIIDLTEDKLPTVMQPKPIPDHFNKMDVHEKAPATEALTNRSFKTMCNLLKRKLSKAKVQDKVAKPQKRKRSRKSENFYRDGILRGPYKRRSKEAASPMEAVTTTDKDDTSSPKELTLSPVKGARTDTSSTTRRSVERRFKCPHCDYILTVGESNALHNCKRMRTSC